MLAEEDKAVRLSRYLKIFISLLITLMIVISSLSACSSGGQANTDSDKEKAESTASDFEGFVVATEEEPDTTDFQCTTYYYTVAMNAFDRLVEMTAGDGGSSGIVPSLAESWEISDDRRTYTFHLRDGVKFSNGAALTSGDVLYTFNRILTYPDSCNQDIARVIEGAEAFEKGEATSLKGFTVISDLDFSITLEKPFEAFLASLSMPGASIMNKETTKAAGDRFGKDPDTMIGTGPYIFSEWKPGSRIVFKANENCWSGVPENKGVEILFLSEPEYIQELYDDGALDIMDLDDLDNNAEYYIHGDIYQDRLKQVQRVAITYIALNETKRPLNDARVRKALQLSLNREALLDAVYGGRGQLENGIFPHGLYGFNENLPEIPFDKDRAKALLEEAGYPEGFDLTVTLKSTSTQWENALMEMAVSMWKNIGVNAKIEILPESEFMDRRKSGDLACYTAMWTADYNDPDNFIYMFFGNRENSRFRSICYKNQDVMKRVRDARMIADSEDRIEEYHKLEEKIVQEDAAWIPLFTRSRLYVVSDRVEGFSPIWSGSVRSSYRTISFKEKK